MTGVADLPAAGHEADKFGQRKNFDGPPVAQNVGSSKAPSASAASNEQPGSQSKLVSHHRKPVLPDDYQRAHPNLGVRRLLNGEEQHQEGPPAIRVVKS